MAGDYRKLRKSGEDDPGGRSHRSRIWPRRLRWSNLVILFAWALGCLAVWLNFLSLIVAGVIVGTVICIVTLLDYSDRDDDHDQGQSPPSET